MIPENRFKAKQQEFEDDWIRLSSKEFLKKYYKGR